MKLNLIAAIAILSAPLLHQPASAADFTSQYVNVGEKDCPFEKSGDTQEGPQSSTQNCVAPDGRSIKIVDYDGRVYVSYDGRDAFSDTNFHSFNTIGKKMEWITREGKAVATILRWYLDTDSFSGTEHDDGTGRSKTQVLKVTKLDSDTVAGCTTAFVDARANKNANELARKAAYSTDKFDCKKDKPYTLGKLHFHFGVESENMGVDQSRSR